jgi:hypothetical protein
MNILIYFKKGDEAALLGGVKKPFPSLLAARDGSTPSIFCILCLTDIVHNI